MQLAHSEIVTSLPLQMCLYFNACFSPFWLLAHIATLYLKFPALHVTYQVILVALHLFTAAVEAVRLTLGYRANLLEKIPQLSGFWITTAILQLPCVCFLLFNPFIYPLPLEIAVDAVQLIFVLLEIGIGFVAVRRLASHQVTKFQQQVLNKSNVD